MKMKKHYDVCIAGFWYGSNYGSLLNGYAMYRILKDYGKEVLMLQKPGATSGDQEIKSGHNVNFVHKYYDPEDISPVLSYAELSKLNKICDCFCAGSDQIWNYNLSFHENLYLPFVESDKKIISFSTSFGHKQDKVPVEARERIKEYLQRYSAISVREQFDVDILHNNYGINAKLLFEPVFCIDKSYYTELASHAKFNEKEPYLLTYILDPTPEKRAAIQYYGEKSGLKVVNILNGAEYVRERNKKLLSLPNVIDNVESEDFLKAFMEAEYVITDSFHGSAFSIIFNKPFLAIGNYGRGFERFIDLLGRLELMDRLVDDPKNIPHDEKYLEKFSYERTNQIILEEAEKTVQWVKSAIDSPKEQMKSILLPKRAVTSVLDKKMCMGCGACVSCCPVNALTLKADEFGYYRSVIDYDKCIDCGKCSEICPALKLPNNSNSSNPKCYEFVAAEDEVLYRSSSGGIFPLLAEESFKKNGCVAGAAWTDEFSVEHIIVDNKEELYKLQKSKYLQSYLGNTFKKIKDILESGRFVLFSGCPCQVTGLKAYLEKDYDNLLTVDLLCGNSPSTMFFKKYLEEAFPDGVKNYEFRYKAQGWNWDCVTVTVTDGTKYVIRGGKEDAYQRVYHNHTMCAPHCEKCRYQTAPRFGDLTIGDFWGIGGKDPLLDTTKGVSVILCNNEKGRRFLDLIPKEKINVMKEVPLKWLGGNGYAINNSHNYCSPKRNRFYEAIKTKSFSQAVNYTLKPNRGIYNDIYKDSNAYLQYDTSMLHFQFDSQTWEEHFINGSTVLTVKPDMWKTGKYAILPLYKALNKGESYICTVRFRLKTESNVLNLHIKDSGSNYYQIIKTYRKTENYNENDWIELTFEFVPESDIYDEFMIGASQIKGRSNYISFNYINIRTAQ